MKSKTKIRVEAKILQISSKTLQKMIAREKKDVEEKLNTNEYRGKYKKDREKVGEELL